MAEEKPQREPKHKADRPEKAVEPTLDKLVKATHKDGKVQPKRPDEQPPPR